MKNWMKKNKRIIFAVIFIIIFIIIFICLIPLAINIAFKHIAPLEIFEAEWDANTALGFYGSLLAGGLTVYGVFLSIQYAQRNYKEDVKNRVLPYLALTHYRSKSKRNLFAPFTQNKSSKNDEETNYYYEFKIEKVYFIIKDSKIDVKNSLTQEEEETIKQGGLKWKPIENGTALVDEPFVSAPMEVENVGNGAAINFRVGFNRVIGDRVYLTPKPLKQNETFYIHIFSENAKSDIQGQYELEFYYEDIYGTNYCQKYPFEIGTDIKTNKIYSSIDFSVKQLKITEGQTNG